MCSADEQGIPSGGHGKNLYKCRYDNQKVTPKIQNSRIQFQLLPLILTLKIITIFINRMKNYYLMKGERDQTATTSCVSRILCLRQVDNLEYNTTVINNTHTGFRALISTLLCYDGYIFQYRFCLSRANEMKTFKKIFQSG